MSRKVTIINYYGSQDDSRCGYCSTTDSSQSHGKIKNKKQKLIIGKCFYFI